MVDDPPGPALTWATHPNAALRLSLADDLGRGWTIETLELESAVVAKRKAWTKSARVLINPFYGLLNLARTDREDRRRLTVMASGDIRDMRV